MALLFLFPAWYFPTTTAFWVIVFHTTFPVVPGAVFVPRDSQACAMNRLVLADVSFEITSISEKRADVVPVNLSQ